MNDRRIPDYSVHGEGATTIFLLHGAYGSKEYWRYLIEALTAKGYRCVAWDAPGYGISPQPEVFTIESAARAFIELLDAAGSDRNVVLGHSTGGCIAQKAYDLAPTAMSALVLSSTFHTFNHSGPEWQEYFMNTRMAPITRGKTIAEYAPDLLRAVMGPGAAGPAVDWILVNVKMMSNESFKAAIGALSQYAGEDILPRIRIPTLCIAGELDITCPPNVMKKMSEMIPDGEYYEVSGVGHFGWAERQDEYLAALSKFLQSKRLNN